MYVKEITYGVLSLLLIGKFVYLTFKNKMLIFMSSSIKDFLDKFFDLCKKYPQEIPPQKMSQILKELADR